MNRPGGAPLSRTIRGAVLEPCTAVTGAWVPRGAACAATGSSCTALRSVVLQQRRKLMCGGRSAPCAAVLIVGIGDGRRGLRAAVVDSSDTTVTAIARELGISSESLRGWYRKAKADRGEGQPGELTSAEREELKRLRRENREQQQTIEIPKRASPATSTAR